MSNISKVILNGTTLMDVTGTTATNNKIISPYTAMIADGTITTGISSNFDINDIATNTQPSGVITLGNAVTTIADHAFRNKPITSIYGPKVTSIGANAFEGTQITDITDANFPILGVSVMYTVLLRCANLQHIKLTGNNIALSSGSYPLRYNSGLITAEFPNAASGVGASYNGTSAYGFSECTNLELVDLGCVKNIQSWLFNKDAKLTTIILRKSDTITACVAINAFTQTPFASGGTGGTIYIPKVLYDHLGDGTSLDYKAATNWSTIDGYGTISWAKIEGSIYE